LACTSSPPMMPMICRFGLLMESQSSCIYLSQLFSLISKYSTVFPFNIYFIFKCWNSVFYLFQSAGVSMCLSIFCGVFCCWLLVYSSVFW
jgi:hypothetical protein